MAGSTPGILPKAALVGSRAIYYPFTIPQKFTDATTLVGSVGNGTVKSINATLGNAFMALQPRGPAKLLGKLFERIDAATTRSEAIAQRNKTVFWDPFSQGTETVGRAIASPGAYWYLHKAGMEQPTQDAIKGLLNLGFFAFPSAPTPPAEQESVPVDAGGGAAPQTSEAPQGTEQPQGAEQPQGQPEQPTGDAGAGAGTVTPAA